MYAEQRQREILDAVTETGRVRVAELAEHYDVATETIRRDLEQLAAASLLVRVHGGAIARRTAVLEPDLAGRGRVHTAAKSRIAAAAAAFLPVDPQAAVLLDAGTTTAGLVDRLAGRTGPVITDSVAIAQACLDQPALDVHILPGRLRGRTGAAVGAETVTAIGRLHPEVAFLGCNGFDEEELTTPDADEAAVKTAMVSQAAFRVLLADSSKAGARHLVTFARTSEIDVLVTDDQLPPEIAGRLAETGIEVLTA